MPHSLFTQELNGNHDFQLWLHPVVAVPLEKKASIQTEMDFRFGANASIFYRFYMQSAYRFPLYKCLEMGLGYRQVFTLDTSANRWRPRYEPLIDLLCNFDIHKWEITTRSRTFYSFRGSLTNRWIQRFLIRAKFPIKLGQATPLLYDEVFFREGTGCYENRFSVGLSFPIVSKIEGSAHYILRHILIDEWVQHNILRIYMTYTF